MEDLNSKRNKRFTSRVGDRRYFYNNNLTSTTYGSGDTYQLTYVGLESLGEDIEITLNIVDGKLDIDNSTIS